MNKGQGLTEMAHELERQRTGKRDYIAPTSQIVFGGSGGALRIGSGSGSMPDMGVTPWAGAQLAQYTGIPKAYYDRMSTEAPALLAENLNTWIQRKDEHRMLRSLDGNVRAVVSRSYRPLDNYDLAEAAIPILQDAGAQVESCSLTNTRLYIKAVTSRVSGEIVKGDVAYAGVVISNSELGNGALKIEQMIFRLVCSNGAIHGAAMRKYHVGARAAAEDSTYELLSDGTRRLDDAALWGKVKDVTRAALSEGRFNSILEQLRGAKVKVIVSDDVAKVVEKTIQVLDLPTTASKGILTQLAKGGDYTAFGLSQAITSTAGETDDYETATLLERAGGTVIELPPTDWKRIAEAA